MISHIKITFSSDHFSGVSLCSILSLMSSSFFHSTTQQEKDLTEDSTVQKDVPNQTTIPVSSPSTAKPSRTNTASPCNSNISAAVAVALQVT